MLHAHGFDVDVTITSHNKASQNSNHVRIIGSYVYDLWS